MRSARTSASSSTVQSVPAGIGVRSATAVCAGARPRLPVVLDLPVVRVDRPVAALAPAPVPRAARRAGGAVSGWVPARGAAVVPVSEVVPLVASATFAVVAFFATVVRTAFTGRASQPTA